MHLFIKGPTGRKLSCTLIRERFHVRCVRDLHDLMFERMPSWTSTSVWSLWSHFLKCCYNLGIRQGGSDGYAGKPRLNMVRLFKARLLKDNTRLDNGQGISKDTVIVSQCYNAWGQDWPRRKAGKLSPQTMKRCQPDMPKTYAKLDNNDIQNVTLGIDVTLEPSGGNKV